MTKYLKLSDMINRFQGCPSVLEAIYYLPVHTFPDPSLAVDGDAISRKDLRDKITKQYLENEIPVGWNASINALLRIINSMQPLPPAPSVDDGNHREILGSSFKLESGNSKLLEMIDCGYVYEITNVEKATDSMLSWLKPILREIARLLAERGDK